MSNTPDNINEQEDKDSGRRDFLRMGVLAAGLTLVGGGLRKVFSEDHSPGGEKVKVLTADGKLVEVSSASMTEHSCCAAPSAESRIGIPGKKYVMIIDLARCKNAMKCQKACSKHHLLPTDDKYLKVFKMQDSPEAAPYWMPKPCLHCDKPPCVKVCPVDATFKRSDGLVLIDNERCIGCRFCMAACPYSTRSFNWDEPLQPENINEYTYSPESSTPRKKGTVEKCDFCPDMLKQGLLPHCVSACPNGVYYFGDANEDTVTNGDETLKFRQLLKDRAGYRYMESLGTEPSVYYLPAVNRLFPFEEEALGTPEIKE